MDPTYLAVDEIDYELRLRKIHISSLNIFEKRKVLRKLLSKDRGRDLDYKDEFFDFERDKDSITNTITSLRQQLSDVASPTNNYDELRSRLIHVTNRVNNIPVSKTTFATVGAFKSEKVAECLLIEFELDERVQSVKPVADSDQVGMNVGKGDVSDDSKCYPKPNAIPIYKWGHVFYGDGSQSVGAFLERLGELREARGATKEDLFRSASDLFDKDARTWYRSIKGSNQVSNWDDLVALLRRDFSAPDDDELWNGIRRRYQQPKERVVIYISNMEGLFNRLRNSPDEATKLQVIRKRLLPYFHIPLANRGKDICSVGELRDVCRILEAAWVCESQDRSPSKSLSAIEPDLVHHHEGPGQANNLVEVGVMTCWNCKAKGHMQRDCPQPKARYCFTCGSAGYTKSTCPLCKGRSATASKN